MVEVFKCLILVLSLYITRFSIVVYSISMNGQYIPTTKLSPLLNDSPFSIYCTKILMRNFKLFTFQFIYLCTGCYEMLCCVISQEIPYP